MMSTSPYVHPSTEQTDIFLPWPTLGAALDSQNSNVWPHPDSWPKGQSDPWGRRGSVDRSWPIRQHTLKFALKAAYHSNGWTGLAGKPRSTPFWPQLEGDFSASMSERTFSLQKECDAACLFSKNNKKIIGWWQKCQRLNFLWFCFVFFWSVVHWAHTSQMRHRMF